MATFAIYKLMFERIGQTNLLAVDDGVSAFDKAQELLEGMLRGSLPMSKINRKKEQVPLECEVKKKMSGITVLVVCNEKNFKYKEKLDDRELSYHPGCWVIIDNRPGVAQVAIERSSSSFDSKTDLVRDLLQDTLNRMFEQYQLGVEINQKWKDGDFWDAVEEQCTVHHDRVKQVVYEFPNTNEVGPIDASSEAIAKLTLLQTIANSVNAAKGTLKLESDKEKVIRLERTQEDMAQMVRMCSQNAYDIKVKFEKYGLYRHGNNFKAFSQINASAVDEFVSGQRVMGGADGNYELIQWLDEVRVITKDYNHDEETKKKRKRRNKA